MPSHLPDVAITDVTLREYGQNVPSAYLGLFTPEARTEIARNLMGAGFRNLEVFSLIPPKLSPAMDRQVLRRIAGALGKHEGIQLITLVPNRAGYRDFHDLGLGPGGYGHTMGVFFSAVESHNLANLGRSINKTLKDYRPVVEDAVSRGVPVAAYISAAFGYREPHSRNLSKPTPETISGYIDHWLDMGAGTVTLTDLQGVADSRETERILEAVLDRRQGESLDLLGYHPHHVSGDQAVSNSWAAYRVGIRRFDSSLGGTGGCITGAPGNQPTEKLVASFHGAGIHTGIDARAVLSLSQNIQASLYKKIHLTESEKQPSA